MGLKRHKSNAKITFLTQSFHESFHEIYACFRLICSKCALMISVFFFFWESRTWRYAFCRTAEPCSHPPLSSTIGSGTPRPRDTEAEYALSKWYRNEGIPFFSSRQLPRIRRGPMPRMRRSIQEMSHNPASSRTLDASCTTLACRLQTLQLSLWQQAARCFRRLSQRPA